MKKTSLFSINWKDLVKGFILAFLTALVTAIGQSITAQSLPTWAQILVDLKLALGAGVAYLIKNFLTNSKGQFLAKEVIPSTPAADPLI